MVEVFDISCLSGNSLFSTIQDDALSIWDKSSSSVTTQDVIKTLGHDSIVLGQHYFIANGTDPATGNPILAPVWDFTSGVDKGNAKALVIAAVVGDIPAPTGTDDVDWLQLKKVKGELADAVYRVDTKGGQPPTSVNRVMHMLGFGDAAHCHFGLQCTVGDSLLSVKFTTKYCEYQIVNNVPC